MARATLYWYSLPPNCAPMFRATDAVGRWGGDEFMVLLECNMAPARERVKRIAEWTFGEYTLTDGAEERPSNFMSRLPLEPQSGPLAKPWRN